MSEEKLVPRLKSNAKYVDAPRFPLIYVYEGQAKSSYEKKSGELLIVLATAMKKMLGA